MSSNEEELNDGEAPSGLFQAMKKRRIQRACDVCRRKKIRCDGGQMPGNRCSNCISYNLDCTYVEAAKKRGPPKGYVESIENRLDKLEKVLRQLCADESAYKELSSLVDKWNPEQPIPKPVADALQEKLTCTNSALPGVAATDIVTSAIRGMADDKALPRMDPAEDDDETNLRLADNLRRMALDPSEYRFFGKSSGAMLIRTALELKGKYTGDESLDISKPLPPFISKREEFWTLRSWERIPEIVPILQFEFPEDDLAMHCVDLYFININLYLPLLHRPSFEKSIKEGLHLTNHGFAHVYLLVCAVGARYSNDRRVLLEGTDSWHSAGWKWFNQVQMVQRSIMAPPILYDLQRYCLSVQFLQGSSAPQSCWTLVGIGIRLAQDVGVHRRKVNNHTMTAEDEMWKRAFWVLVCMDRMVSSSLGRPCAIQDEDFDCDLPIDCDDEYWDNDVPELRFKQPIDKPSLITAFILYIRLHQILAFSLRTLYSINKSKVLLGLVGPQWEQHIVAELDSALNRWVDSVPDHLRWDPNREDKRFFNQSATLYAAYYHVQILVHRPFIPSPSKPSPLSFPSLAICTNAARSCTHIVDIQQKRIPGVLAIPQIQVCMSLFTSGVVLLLSIWGGKRSGLSTDPSREMTDVYKCMNILKIAEERWHSAGRLWDILYELAYVGNLPLPQPGPPGNKRERDAEEPISDNVKRSEASTRNINAPRNIAGSRRVGKDSSFAGQSRRSGQMQSTPSASMNALHRQQTSHPVSPTSDSTQPSTHQKYPKSEPSSSSSTPSSSNLSYQTSPTCATPSSSTPPSASAVEECFSLPVYSNELGSLPLHGGFIFSAQAATTGQSPPQQQNANFWFSFREPATPFTSIAGQSHSGLGLGSSHTNNLRHEPLDNNFGSMIGTNNNDIASTLGAQMQPQSAFGYGVDAQAAMAAGMMFDGASPLAGVNFDQLSSSSASSSAFNLGGSSSNVNPGSGNGGSMHIPPGNVYRPSGTSAGVGLDDLMTDGTLGTGSQQQQQPISGIAGGGNAPYDFMDNDTMTMWSRAPTGLALDEWGTYLTNVSELMQGHTGHQLSDTGSAMDHTQHSHHQRQGL